MNKWGFDFSTIGFCGIKKKTNPGFLYTFRM